MLCLNLDQRTAILPGIAPRRIIREMRWSTHGEISATAAARERLVRWVASGTPDADPDDLVAFGDISILQQARRVLASLPPPCVWYLTQHIAVVGVGRNSGGWCQLTPTSIDCRRLIALPGTADDHAVRHEYGHGWLHGEEDVAPEEYAEAFATIAGDLDELARRRQRREREADAVAAAWLRLATTTKKPKMRTKIRIDLPARVHRNPTALRAGSLPNAEIEVRR